MKRFIALAMLTIWQCCMAATVEHKKDKDHVSLKTFTAGRTASTRVYIQPTKTMPVPLLSTHRRLQPSLSSLDRTWTNEYTTHLI